MTTARSFQHLRGEVGIEGRAGFGKGWFCEGLGWDFGFKTHNPSNKAPVTTSVAPVPSRRFLES